MRISCLLETGREMAGNSDRTASKVFVCSLAHKVGHRDEVWETSPWTPNCVSVS